MSKVFEFALIISSIIFFSYYFKYYIKSKINYKYIKFIILKIKKNNKANIYFKMLIYKNG